MCFLSETMALQGCFIAYSTLILYYLTVISIGLFWQMDSNSKVDCFSINFDPLMERTKYLNLSNLF